MDRNTQRAIKIDKKSIAKFIEVLNLSLEDYNEVYDENNAKILDWTCFPLSENNKLTLRYNYTNSYANKEIILELIDDYNVLLDKYAYRYSWKFRNIKSLQYWIEKLEEAQELI